MLGSKPESDGLGGVPVGDGHNGLLGFASPLGPFPFGHRVGPCRQGLRRRFSRSKA